MTGWRPIYGTDGQLIGLVGNFVTEMPEEPNVTDAPEMVERVARALRDFYIDDDLYNVARAAIEAMREPTSAMLVSACAAVSREQVRQIPFNRTDAATCWQAAIDVALGKAPHGQD